jgi:DNA-binding CsgD family transcriptional regulator/tetratricopeptide (TPR) repeat protein
MAAASRDIIGRTDELVGLERLVADAESSAAGLLLDGEAGIGKTTVWLAGAELAAREGLRVLSCRPAEAETVLPFVALGDILEPVLDDVLPVLPAAQRSSLETALLRGAVSGATDQLAVSRGTLAALLEVAREEPLLLAIDDVQWLDGPTAHVLEFALRRLADRPVRLLIARRSDREQPPPLGLARALHGGRLEALRVGPLSVGDLDRLLAASLGLRWPRPRLVELHRASGGNPFYALEIARAAGAGPIAVPESLRDLVQARLEALSPAARDAVSLAAAALQPTSSLVEAAAGDPAGLAEATAGGVLVLEGERIRFAHPLLASTAYGSAAPWERRDVHRRLAAVATGEERARHLAAGVDHADAEVAAELEQAATLAAARGAPESAAELAEHAARLTPDALAADRSRRLAAAAEHHIASGDPARGRAVLEQLVGRLEPGPERADLLWRLADAVGDDLHESIRLCEQALDEARGDAARLGPIHSALATFTWIGGELERAAEHRRLAAVCAEESGDTLLLAESLADGCYIQTMLGLPWDRDAMQRALELERAAGQFDAYLRPSFQLGIILCYTDELEEARPHLAAQLERMLGRGDEGARVGVLFRLAELELRAGNWAEALRLARECSALAAQAGIEQEQEVGLMVHALVAGHVGQVDEARDAAEQALAMAEAGGDRIVAVRSRGVLGFIELSLGDVQAAHEWLAPAADELRATGVGELSIQAVVENEIEALAALERLSEAEGLIAYVEEKGASSGRAWHEAIAARGRALVAAAGGDLVAAASHLERALKAHERLPQPFELGRTLLVQGVTARRAKQRAVARAALGRALELFDVLGTPLWAEKAATELERVPGRRRGNAPGLTATERRVAELVAQGLANKEVAAALFVSVRTVEANLTKVYEKLGVRSRTELAGRLVEQSERGGSSGGQT